MRHQRRAVREAGFLPDAASIATRPYIAGDAYTIADMAIYPWYGMLTTNGYGASEYLAVHEYANFGKGVERVGERPAVQRGRMVNRAMGKPENQLRERHDARDFEVNTQDKVEARGGERV